MDGEPGGPGQSLGTHDSGARRVLRENVAREAQPEELEDPWASDPAHSLLSVASWLVDSVRGAPAPNYRAALAPAITVGETNLSVEEAAAVEADLAATRQLVSESDVEVGQAVLSFDEVEAIDDFDLAPLRQAFERGDHLGLLVEAEALLEVRPSMSAALRYLAAARESLRRRYLTELGGQQEVPQKLMNRNDGVPARVAKDEAFMLGLIDGVSTLEEIVDRSQLPQVLALELVNRLCALGLVGCGERHASYC
jgi:hypothetical protein